MPKARLRESNSFRSSGRKCWTRVAGRLSRAWLILAALALIGGLATACAAGEESAAPTPSPTQGQEGIPAACLALQNLKTYRYSVQLELESPEPAEGPAQPTVTPTTAITRPYTGDFLFEYQVDADFVAPDRTSVLIDSGGGELAMIVIGQEVWTRMGEGGWARPQHPPPLPYQPLDICQALLPELDLSSLEPQEEEANDVKALRYTLPEVSAGQALVKIFGPESDMAFLISTLDADLWLAKKDGWPVRMEISGSGLYGDGRELRVYLLIDIKDVNSDDITVEPPV
jgi:hypothetical protein